MPYPLKNERSGDNAEEVDFLTNGSADCFALYSA